MKNYFAKYWFFLGIAVVIAVAFKFPGVGVKIKQWNLLKAGIFAAFLITGLTLETKSIANEIRNFKTLAASLISCFVLFPLVAFFLAKLFFRDNTDLVVGVCILSAAPVTVASGTIFTAIARGNVPLSLFISVVTNVTAIFTIPLALNLLLRFDQDIDLPILRMMRSLILVVLLPTLIGQIMRLQVKDKLVSFRRAFSIFSQLVVLLIVLNAVASSTARISELGLRIAYVFVFVFFLHFLILVMNLGISRLIRLDLASTAAFTIHTSQKTLTVSFIVWDGYFAQFALGMIPTIVHHLTQSIADTIVAHRFRSVAERAGSGQPAAVGVIPPEQIAAK